MAGKWYAVHDIATGRLESVGTVVAPPAVLAAKGLEAIEVGDAPPDFTAQEWEPKGRRFTAREKRDHAAEFLARDDGEIPAFRDIVAGLKPSEQAIVRRVLAQVAREP